MSPERLKRLEATGFVWDAMVDKWQEGFSKLEQFLAREGHCRVPTSHKENGYKLGAWVSNQRSKKANMYSERIDRLDELGFVWDSIAVAWEEGFNKLQCFHVREGHCQVPFRYKDEDGYNLGRWVSRQRANRDTLSSERLERLEALGDRKSVV